MAGKVSWGISIPQVFFDGPIDMPLISAPSPWALRAFGHKKPSPGRFQYWSR